MIKIFINGKDSGIIVQNTLAERTWWQKRALHANYRLNMKEYSK